MVASSFMRIDSLQLFSIICHEKSLGYEDTLRLLSTVGTALAKQCGNHHPPRRGVGKGAVEPIPSHFSGVGSAQVS